MTTGFSYMSFLIKDKVENHDSCCEKNSFDVTPFNYIFNRSSSFLDSELLADNYLVLENVLANCYKYDEDIIEQLAYF